MLDRELDEAIATKVFGWRRDSQSGLYRDAAGEYHGMNWFTFQPSQRLDQAHEAAVRTVEKVGIKTFMFHLHDTLSFIPFMGRQRLDQIWELFNASPKQIGMACLAAVGEEGGGK